MTKDQKEKDLVDFLSTLYPQTEVFLHSSSEWTFLIAVILSAQAQDKVVNQVTPVLFRKYPDLNSLSEAGYDDVLSIIARVGLGPSKAKNIIALGKILYKDYKGQVPHDRQELIRLPGVGWKTAGVFLGEMDQASVIPVDTHIKRISVRLGLAKEKDETDKIEKILEKHYSGKDMMNFHRQMILFGRNICLASKKRRCEMCPLMFCLERMEK